MPDQPPVPARPAPPPPAPGSYLEALRRALPPPDDLPRTGTEAGRAQAYKLAERGRLDMGAGIDPKMVIAALEHYGAALRVDPSCLEIYTGLSRAVQALASKRPAEAEELLSAGIAWVEWAARRFPNLQETPPIHEVELKLRNLRREARERPKAVQEGGVRVQLERDAEGRVIAPRPARAPRGLAQTSSQLRALVPGLGGAEDPEGEGGLPRWLAALGLPLLGLGAAGLLAGWLHPVAAGVLAGLGLSTVLVHLLVRAGRHTWGVAPPLLVLAFVLGGVQLAHRLEPAPELAWPDADLGERAARVYLGSSPRLVVGAELRPERALSGLLLAHETGRPLDPLRPDPLQQRLPAELAAPAPAQVRHLVVVRRHTAEVSGDRLTLLWALDLQQGLVVARTALVGRDPAGLEEQAAAWVTGLSRPPWEGR